MAAILDFIADDTIREIVYESVKKGVAFILSGGLNLLWKAIQKIGMKRVAIILISDAGMKGILEALSASGVFDDLAAALDKSEDKKLVENAAKHAIVNTAYKRAEEWYLQNKAQNDEIVKAAGRAASDAVSKIMKISIVDFIPIVGDMKMYEEIKTVLNGTTVKEAAQLAATQKAHDIIKAWPDSDQQKQTLAMAKGIQMKIKELDQMYKDKLIPKKFYFSQLTNYMKELGYNQPTTSKM